MHRLRSALHSADMHCACALGSEQATKCESALFTATPLSSKRNASREGRGCSNNFNKPLMRSNLPWLPAEEQTGLPRQPKTQDQTRQAKTRQGRTSQDKTRQDKTGRQDKTRQDQTKQNKTSAHCTKEQAVATTKQRERERHKQTDGQTNRQTYSKHRQAGIQAKKLTDRQTDRQTDRERERDGQTSQQTTNWQPTKHANANKKTNE